jgi:hypothetical protein
VTRFDPATLARLAAAREVEIVTRNASEVHATTIWIVVDGADRVLIRSVNGASARWYREARAQPDLALLIGSDRLAVRAAPASDSERVAACSAALRVKYGGSSLASMLRAHTLPTTLELVPR